jgi:hypothetical protein
MVINSGDVHYLLILDNYDEFPEFDTDLLSTAWYNIYNEFSEAVGGNRSDLWLLKQKRLVSLKMNYELGAIALRVVQSLPHPDTIEIAKEYGYDIDLKNFPATFEKAYTQLMRLKNQVSALDNEVKEEEPGGDLDGLITTLERHQGYQFDETRMTVKKFAAIYKSFKNAKDRV